MTHSCLLSTRLILERTHLNDQKKKRWRERTNECTTSPHDYKMIKWNKEREREHATEIRVDVTCGCRNKCITRHLTLRQQHHQIFFLFCLSLFFSFIYANTTTTNSIVVSRLNDSFSFYKLTRTHPSIDEIWSIYLFRILVVQTE